MNFPSPATRQEFFMNIVSPLVDVPSYADLDTNGRIALLKGHPLAPSFINDLDVLVSNYANVITNSQVTEKLRQVAILPGIYLALSFFPSTNYLDSHFIYLLF